MIVSKTGDILVILDKWTEKGCFIGKISNIYSAMKHPLWNSNIAADMGTTMILGRVTVNRFSIFKEKFEIRSSISFSDSGNVSFSGDEAWVWYSEM